MENPVLKISNISRSFGAIHALKKVDFEINRGEIMGLVGENGAGKSTLVKIISGFDNGYEGEYKLNGEVVRFENPVKAELSGIAIAQQELSLIPNMSVAENIFLAGAKVKKFATIKKLSEEAKPYLDAVGLTDIDPSIRINLLSVGEQHLVEVARLISHDAQILILDEPTAALGEQESRRILEMVQKIADSGKSIIYISHRLDEIFKITNRIAILRDGESQGIINTKDLNVDSLVEMMLGRELKNMFPVKPTKIKEDTILEVKNLWPDGLIEPVNFKVQKGEILGLAGQLGSGAGEVLAAIAGALQIRSGSLVLNGKEFMPSSPQQAIKNKIAYCSSDRKKDGLFLGRPIMENLTSPALEVISKFGIRSASTEQKYSKNLALEFLIDVKRLNDESGLLSGGNQQKVALGKWLSISPEILLVNEPTRGVDVGAKSEIYQRMRELADNGTTIIFASTDIQEVTYLPERVLSFYQGLLIREFGLNDIKTTSILKQITDPFNETNL
ncbi:MAG: sugar ABC transporter ATP-binding protein [Alphaproteobacteria bacterium]|jgi:ribose transport system ATP-binding protein|tara:strand:+ start:5641 stop:7146 length:1506 start_codon:yes stop_codon:yes gene_type:complete